ncbi:hypothetical protein WMY93_020488 [Mugilogobius chulae]|uniref:Uncharacterized protein n=1 Tax=Mugilogobius chulae TaxID=88201 RepID=A0AAW0NSH0_9GOBI
MNCYVGIVLCGFLTWIPMASAEPGLRGTETLAQTITYSRETLLSMRDNASVLPGDLVLPPDCRLILRQRRKKKRRGSRGGIRNRLKRRGSRHPLPVITLSNVRSLNNKLDELLLLVRHDEDFRRSNLICLTETWLNDQSEVELPGYITIRADRDTKRSGKSIGGGLCMFVDQSRFDSTDAKGKAYAVCANVSRDQIIQLSVDDVQDCLSHINPHKAPGPDGLAGRVLKVCSVANKNKLNRIVKNAGKIIGKDQAKIELLYQSAVLRMAMSITRDIEHPLCGEFKLMPSGRRYRMPLATKKCRPQLLLSFRRMFMSVDTHTEQISDIFNGTIGTTSAKSNDDMQCPIRPEL